MTKMSHLRKTQAATWMLMIGLGAKALPGQTAIPADNKPVRLNRAPVSDEVLRVHLPRAQKRTLPNGLRILVLENHKSPSISMRVVINGAGGVFDSEGQSGLAAMTAQMLMLGTERYSSSELAQKIDTLGANIHASASTDGPAASLEASGLSSNFSKWLPLLADVLLHPTFSSAELEDAKRRQLATLQSQQSRASFLAAQYLLKDLYGDSPYGAISATPASTQAFTVQGLREFYMHQYSPQNTVVILEGDIAVAAAFAAISEQFSSWTRTNLIVHLPPVKQETAPRKVILVDRPGSVQTNLLIGRLGIDRRDPDYIRLAVTNNILGGGGAGRLFMRLREEKSYTYGAYSSLEAEDHRGMILASSEVRSAVTGVALDEFFNEFALLGTDPVGPEELDRHKRSMVASFALSLENPTTMINYVYIQDHYGLPDGYWDQYAAEISKVSTSDVIKMGAKYYSPEKMQVVAVGDPSIKDSMSKWGELDEVKP